MDTGRHRDFYPSFVRDHNSMNASNGIMALQEDHMNLINTVSYLVHVNSIFSALENGIGWTSKIKPVKYQII